MRYISTMKTKRRPGTRPANPEQSLTMTLGFAASEADPEGTERLAANYSVMPWSQVVETGVHNLLPSAWNALATAQRVLR